MLSAKVDRTLRLVIESNNDGCGIERQAATTGVCQDVNRQIVDILTAALTGGLSAVETACAEAMAAHLLSPRRSCAETIVSAQAGFR
jgi:hypothetical protein